MYRKEVLPLLPERIRKIIEKTVKREEKLQEIRIRKGRPPVLQYGGELIVPECYGQVVTDSEFREVLTGISRYSLYAFEEEIRKGYLTIPGGHRVGLSGHIVLENGMVKTIRYISFLNIRISHELPGCADRLMPYVMKGEDFLSTMIMSPPGGGKTTLLRDMVRKLATGGSGFRGRNVSLVDERSEIAGCYSGIPQKEVGPFCDVMDACPKNIGIMMVLRSMAPEVIAVDEVGMQEDLEAMNHAITGGCSLLATVHGSSMEQMKEKPVLSQMLKNRMFERYILLGEKRNPGNCRAIYDGGGNLLWS